MSKAAPTTPRPTKSADATDSWSRGVSRPFRKAEQILAGSLEHHPSQPPRALEPTNPEEQRKWAARQNNKGCEKVCEPLFGHGNGVEHTMLGDVLDSKQKSPARELHTHQVA